MEVAVDIRIRALDPARFRNVVPGRQGEEHGVLRPKFFSKKGRGEGGAEDGAAGNIICAPNRGKIFYNKKNPFGLFIVSQLVCLLCHMKYTLPCQPVQHFYPPLPLRMIIKF